MPSVAVITGETSGALRELAEQCPGLECRTLVVTSDGSVDSSIGSVLADLDATTTLLQP